MRLTSKATYMYMFCIIVLSLFLRFYHLGILPSSMQDDEVMTGYVGRYIIQNGQDVHGNKWPLLYFNKFGDFYIIGPIYMKGLATYAFGVNAFAVRFPTAFFGALTVIPVYLIASLLFQSVSVGLFSALAVAIMPWTIPLGRASSEGILGGFFFLFGVYYLLLGYKEDSNKHIIAGGLWILFTFWIYHNFRFLSSLFVFGFLVMAFFEKKLRRKSTYVLGILLTFFVLITVLIGMTPWGRGRFDQIGILSPISGVAGRTQELIYGEGTGNVLITRVFHNKVLGYGREFIRQYLIHFSGDFLWIKGGKSEVYAVPEQGLLYLSFFVPLALCLLLLTNQKWIQKYKFNLLLLIYFILISPIPSALTVIDAPNIQRSILLGLFLSIPVGLGLSYLWTYGIKHKYIFVIFALILFAEMGYFWHNYTVHTDVFTSIYRNDGQKELISYIRVHDKNIVYLPTSGTMSMYYLFYNQDFSASYAGIFQNHLKVDRLQNIRFIDSECPSEVLKGKIKPGDIVVDPMSSCGGKSWEKYYSQETIITGANKLLGFRVLKKLSQ